MGNEELRMEAEAIRERFLNGEIGYDEAAKLLKPFKKAFDEMSKEKAEKYGIARPQKLNISMYLKMKGLPRATKKENTETNILQEIEKQAITHERLIYVGLDESEKLAAIRQYLNKNKITNIVYFYPCGMNPLDLSQFDLPVENRTFWDIIRYVFNTPLLENVNDKYLIIYDEMMRVKNRRDLTYNTTHHVANQTSHIITFSRFPIISQKDDFMKLIDMSFPWKWGMQKYSMVYVDLPEVYIKPVRIKYDIIPIGIDEESKASYESLKKDLFDNLGKKAPDTVPRNLQIYAGTLKKTAIENGNIYLARNARFKRDNVCVWKSYRLFDSMTQTAGSGESKHQGKVITARQINEAYLLDTPTSDIEFVDFLRLTGVRKLHYIDTGLPVDKYYAGTITDFFENLKEFYGEVDT